jgi:hypothetical protein
VTHQLKKEKNIKLERTSFTSQLVVNMHYLTNCDVQIQNSDKKAPAQEHAKKDLNFDPILQPKKQKRIHFPFFLKGNKQ